MQPSPASPTLGRALFVCGDESGVGKTSFCLGLLHHALTLYEPSQIAYIKPCTQCEDVQLLWKWCHSVGIECHGIGPILYRRGYTQECIDGQHGSSIDRLESIAEQVNRLRLTHRFVVVDGVGYPGVGSCVGCSNGHVAKHLNIPVLLIARPGVGNSIDSIVMNTEYFAYHGVITLGVVVNKMTRKVSYHTYPKMVEYITKFFETYRYTPVVQYNNTLTHHHQQPQQHHHQQRKIHVYGFVPDYSSGNTYTSCAVSCALKPNLDISQSFDLTLTDDDKNEIDTIFSAQENIDFLHLLVDIDQALQCISKRHVFIFNNTNDSSPSSSSSASTLLTGNDQVDNDDTCKNTSNDTELFVSQ